MIKPNLTFEQIRELVDQLITPERADEEAKALMRIFAAVHDGDTSDDCHDLMMVAAHHAFQKTISYNNAFERFAGIVRPDFSEAKNETVSDALEHVN